MSVYRCMEGKSHASVITGIKIDQGAKHLAACMSFNYPAHNAACQRDTQHGCACDICVIRDNKQSHSSSLSSVVSSLIRRSSCFFFLLSLLLPCNAAGECQCETWAWKRCTIYHKPQYDTCTRHGLHTTGGNRLKQRAHTPITSYNTTRAHRFLVRWN